MLKAIKNNFYMFMFLFTFSKKFTIISLFIGLLSLYHSLVSIFLLRYIIDSITDPKANFTGAASVVFIVCLINVIIALTQSWFNNNYLPNTRLLFRKYFNEKLYLRSLDVDISQFDNPDFYNDYTFVINDAENRVFSVFNSIRDFVVNIAKLIMVLSTIIFVFYDPLLIVFPVITLITTTFLFTKVQKHLFIRNQANIPLEREMDYLKRVFYLKEYTKSLRLSEIKNVLIRNFEYSTEKSKELFTQFSKKIIPVNFLLTVVFELFNRFGLLFYLFWRAFSKLISIGDFSGLYNAAENLLSGLQAVSEITKNFYENNLYIEKFKKYYDFNNYATENGGKALDLFQSKEYVIRFDKVNFKYEFHSRYVLKNISFECRKGEKIAIVGHNGAGKTTLINLLLKLYRVTDGSISINDINIDMFDFNSYRKNFNAVHQDFSVFAVTIAENVSMDIIQQPDYINISNALDIVGLGKKIEKMDCGLDTIVTKEFDQKGVVLSGGETQKLALARLFIKDVPVLILDEPSSALDPLSEYEIFKHIFDKYKENTIFFVSHRLYTATLSDKIIVLDNGEIIEMGTHNQLLKNNGIYANLYKVTTENYKIENDENKTKSSTQPLTG